MTTAQRFVSFRLLKLLESLAAKRAEMQRIGIQLELMADLYERVGAALFEIKDIDPAQANTLWLYLEDFITGRIKEYELLSLIAVSGAAVRICDYSTSK
jgi:hypothetical protein